jgi:hypothetical protein
MATSSASRIDAAPAQANRLLSETQFVIPAVGYWPHSELGRAPEDASLLEVVARVVDAQPVDRALELEVTAW